MAVFSFYFCAVLPPFCVLMLFFSVCFLNSQVGASLVFTDDYTAGGNVT